LKTAKIRFRKGSLKGEIEIQIEKGPIILDEMKQNVNKLWFSQKYLKYSHSLLPHIKSKKNEIPDLLQTQYFNPDPIEMIYEKKEEYSH
jgi:hypothetical protein